ncbi:hypothetical protein AB0F11_33615, partial [Streptomyces sp. NPDC032472]
MGRDGEGMPAPLTAPADVAAAAEELIAGDGGSPAAYEALLDAVFADPVTGIVAEARLDYTYSPGRAQT